MLNNNFSFFFFLATFDVKDRARVYFNDFPSISEFTICFWMKLYDPGVGGGPVSFHYNQKNSQIMIFLSSKDGDIVFEFLAAPDSKRGDERQR